MNNQEVYEQLANEYGVPVEQIEDYANLIWAYDFVQKGTQEQFMECLEMFVQKVCTMNFMIEQSENSEHKNAEYDSLAYTISDCLYRVYGDLALESLSEDYLTINCGRL